MSKITTLAKMSAAGIKLRELRKKIDEIEEAARVAKNPFQEEKDKLEVDMLLGFKALGINSIKLQTGENVTRSVGLAAAIVNERKAIEWAKSVNLVRIDMKLSAMMLKQEFIDKGIDLPDGFEKVERESVKVTLPKPKVDKTESEKKI